jgi:uncharacterized protein YcbK (DUF882 family)
VSRWSYFKRDEFVCKETGTNQIKDSFIDELDDLRESCGFPFAITSGYRSPMHSKEASKPNGPGKHSEGIAADIAVADGVQRYQIVRHAIVHGFTGIGIAKTFIHVDRRDGQPVIWVY